MSLSRKPHLGKSKVLDSGVPVANLTAACILAWLPAELGVLWRSLSLLSCQPLGPNQKHLSKRPWDSPGKNTRVGCYLLFQGIFLTQGLNLGLLHCRQTLYALSHQGRPTSQIRLGLFLCVKLKRHTLCVNVSLKTPVEQNEDPRYRE